MKKVSIGGGIMADRIKYGKHVVAFVNAKAPQEEVQEFYRLAEAAPEMVEALKDLRAKFLELAGSRTLPMSFVNSYDKAGEFVSEFDK